MTAVIRRPLVWFLPLAPGVRHFGTALGLSPVNLYILCGWRRGSVVGTSGF